MKQILVVISAVWACLGAYLLSLSGGCDANDASKVFQCLSANELGDFLAGFFAPLAFLWVAYAVIIQSQELAAQRAELEMTRKELELTREVAVEAKDATRSQAEEAKRSADLFSQQTKMMRAEHEAQEQKIALELFEIRWRAFDARSHWDVKLVTPQEDNSTQVVSAARFRLDEKDEFLKTVDAIQRLGEGRPLAVSTEKLDQSKETLQLAHDCVELWQKLSQVEQERNERYKSALDDFIWCSNSLDGVIKKYNVKLV